MKNKKLYCIFIIFLISIFILFPFKLSATENKITKINIETDENGKTHIEGTTEGQTNSMKILVKIYNEKKEFEYFNMISINDNSFDFYYKPSLNSNVEDGDTLTLKIQGDLKYETTFYYSSKYDSPEEEHNEDIIDLLNNYAIYYDDIIDIKLKFTIDFNQETDIATVNLNGTNFTSDDEFWKMKDEQQWKSFLDTILKKIKEIINKDVWIYVYDSNGNELESYPEEQPDEVKNYITQDELDNILNDYPYLKSNKIEYNFTYILLNEGKSKYIKIKAKSDYGKKDDEWKDLDKDKLESFAEKLANAIRKKYNADIDIVFYDKDDNLLNSYSFDLYKDNANDDDDNSNIEFIPWNKNRATGLVLMLRVSDYGENSIQLTPNIKEGKDSGLYSYEIELNEENVENQLQSLRNDSQKIVYVNQETDTNNILFTIDSEIVEILKDNKCLFIFDCNNYKIEMDFTDFKKSGDIEIQTMDVDMSSDDDYAKPIGLKINLDGKEATNYFKDGIKCLLHYDSEKTRNIQDLRSINVYDSVSTMLNTTASTKEKGFIFKYNDANIYYAKSNQFNFNDIDFDDIKYKQYAQLVASKNIIPGINNGKFNPKQQLTRGDFIYYISNKMGALSETNHFENLDINHPYFKQINGVYELGILPSIYKNNISPDTPVTIEEIIYMTIRCYEINDENNQDIQTASLVYLDKDNISVWAQPKISKAVKLGMIPSDGELLPKDIATKLDASEIFYGLLVAENIF